MTAARAFVTIVLCGTIPGNGAADTTSPPIHAQVAKGKASAAGIGLPADTETRNILAERVDTLAGQEDGIGIVVGIIGPLDSYVGRYEAPGEGLFSIVREGDFLMIQLPDDWGLPRMHLRPESPRDFFTSELPLRVTFQTGADGRVNGVLIYPPRGRCKEIRLGQVI